MSKQAWIVVGASSAIARAFARAVAAEGADVLVVGRDRPDLEATAADLGIRYRVRAETALFDAADFATHRPLLARAETFAGDAVLNLFVAVGRMPPQSAIDAEPALVREVVDTNYAGVAHFLQLAAPVYEARRQGRIVVLGSVAGDRGRPKNYVYGSAKAGLHAYLQGLRARLWRAGVAVTTVKPGPVDTAMTFGLGDMPLLAAPDAVAAACLKAARRGQEVLYVPTPWLLIMAILRAIPERFFKRLDI